MSSHLNDFSRFFGHLHPMLVHLPVGGLVLLGLLELLAIFPRFADTARNRRVILGLVAAGSVATVACGWLLSQSGGYDAQLMYWHRLSGFGLTGACIVTLFLCRPQWQRGYRLSLLTTLVLLVFAGHYGSAMTHGRGFFTLWADAAPSAATGLSQTNILQRPLYAEVVRPILQRRCGACHGPEKQKGELRLDSLAALQKGGQSGRAFVAGKAGESLMIRRLLLPLEHEDHMPPEGKPQPTVEEIGLLQWWINAGAPEAGRVGDLKPDANVLRMLGTVAAAQHAKAREPAPYPGGPAGGAAGARTMSSSFCTPRMK